MQNCSDDVHAIHLQTEKNNAQVASKSVRFLDDFVLAMESQQKQITVWLKIKTQIKICLLLYCYVIKSIIITICVDETLLFFFFFLGLLHGHSILKLIQRFSRNNVQYLRNSTLYNSQDLLHPSKLGSGFEHIVVALGMV
jgi:hypothetical protein